MFLGASRDTLAAADRMAVCLSAPVRPVPYKTILAKIIHPEPGTTNRCGPCLLPCLSAKLEEYWKHSRATDCCEIRAWQLCQRVQAGWGKASLPSEWQQIPEPLLQAVSQSYGAHVAGQASWLPAPSAVFEFACHLEAKLAEGQGLENEMLLKHNWELVMGGGEWHPNWCLHSGKEGSRNPATLIRHWRIWMGARCRKAGWEVHRLLVIRKAACRGSGLAAGVCL